jgi:dienelactone hydrolase
MVEVVLFHHAQGLTPGILSFADELRAEGRVVHVPDLYEGAVFAELSDGVRHAEEEVGFDTIIERGRAAVEGLPDEVVYAGFSLGVLPAQMLAQTQPGAKGALLFHGAVPPSEFGTGWPPGVPLQIHMMDRDPFALEGDLDVARELEATVDDSELFLYRGDRHLFADSSLADFDPVAAALLKERVLGFLARIK